VSACPKGGDHVPRFPATRTNGWIIHYCRKCGAELDRRKAPALARGAAAVAVTAAAVITGLAAALIMAAWLYMGTAG
jgi:hypothetical protein